MVCIVLVIIVAMIKLNGGQQGDDDLATLCGSQC